MNWFFLILTNYIKDPVQVGDHLLKSKKKKSIGLNNPVPILVQLAALF